MRIDIPGFEALDIKHVLCDFNGTLAIDGELIEGVEELINELSSSDSVDYDDIFILILERLVDYNFK